ncbi:UDP-glucose 6-dehydrogenase YwqF [compost metagenome]
MINQIKIASADFTARTGRAPVIACLGLAFKPDVDDLRESPALHVTQHLTEAGYNVIAVEPNITQHATLRLANLDEALRESDIVILLVKHKEFILHRQTIGFGASVVIDYCGINATPGQMIRSQEEAQV